MDSFHPLLLFLSNNNLLPVFSVKSPIISIGPSLVFVNYPFMRNAHSQSGDRDPLPVLCAETPIPFLFIHLLQVLVGMICHRVEQKSCAIQDDVPWDISSA